MPPTNPLALIPAPATLSTHPPRDPFHDTPAFETPPYKSEEDLAEERKAEADKVHEESLEEAQALLRKLNSELRDADSKRIRPLTIQIQRVRVSILLLQESHSGIADPATYRELSLLNKLVAGKGLDDMSESDAREETQKRLTAAEDRLAERGADPAMAQRLARILSVVMKRPTPLKPEPVDGHPDAAAG